MKRLGSVYGACTRGVQRGVMTALLALVWLVALPAHAAERTVLVMGDSLSAAYGLAPERRVSDGDGVPCRHCLQDVAAASLVRQEEREGLQSLDSVDALELGLAIQKKYGIKIDADAKDTRNHFTNVASLAAFVTAKQAA